MLLLKMRKEHTFQNFTATGGWQTEKWLFYSASSDRIFYYYKVFDSNTTTAVATFDSVTGQTFVRGWLSMRIQKDICK